MMAGHRIINQNSLHFLTFTVVGWVDVFTRKKYRDIFIDSLKYCIEHKELLIFSYVIMSNHIHLIVRTDSQAGLSAIIRDLKTFTSKSIIKAILENPGESRSEWMLRLFKFYAKFNKNNSKYQFWQQDNKPIELVSLKCINQKLDYIHLNPVKAEIVELPEHYLYSSARNYIGQQGLIEVEILDFRNNIGYIDL
ncbi:MAG: transposase [Lewinellaceae bacterium]|nr:transposase [Lewinellaceae bacterium]